MAYAIVQTGGHQYKVAPGDTIEVEKLDVEPGADVELGEVLMVIGDDGVQIGSPLVSGAKVLARVVSQGRGHKLIVFGDFFASFSELRVIIINVIVVVSQRAIILILVN